MARSPGQVMMFNDNELALIKNTFAENDEYLFAVRKVLLQFPLSESERGMVKSFTSPAVFSIIKKRVHPDLDPDAPLFQLADLYQGLTNDLMTKTVSEMAPRLEAKKLQIEYLDQQFAILQDLDNAPAPTIILDRMKHIGKGIDEMYSAYVGNLARNHILSWVDSSMNYLKTIAGTKKETPEEQKKRLERDSSK